MHLGNMNTNSDDIQVRSSYKMLWDVMSSTNHVDVSMLYLFLGVFSGVYGSSMSLLFRLQLSYPVLLTSDLYNSFITLHGLIMVFFAAMPTAIGFYSNMLIPYHCGLPDLVFPRLNALSFWIMPMSLFMLTSSMASTGWTLYPPLSTLSANIEYTVFSLHLAGLSSILSSCNFLVSMLSTRSYAWYSLSLFCWSNVFVIALLLLSLPVLAVAITLILLDLHLSTSFYDSSLGGDPLLYQHLFWFFGHPEVYVVILPVFGLFSTSIQWSTLHRIPGEYSLIGAMGSIAGVGSVVWAHHMYTAGLDLDTRAYFTAATMIIAVPTGIKIFTWLSAMSLMRRMTSLSQTMMQCAFLFTFAIGGTSGIVLSNASLDHYLHDTYYVVGHFHIVMALSLVYGLLAGYTLTCSYLSYVTSSILSGWTSLFVFSSFALFALQHYQGYVAMPRRYYLFSDTSSHTLITLCLITSLLGFMAMLMNSVIGVINSRCMAVSHNSMLSLPSQSANC
uniref:Cytochrome c oxidase subunit 1 n=1 Tax=Dicyemennea floscephalum TaxID=1393954 RepID=V9P5H0_DICFL|nr:cytochrome c oxidase subunit I [Dicyemennea floscephalum]AGU60039.1 cytochrome c oxidase subunit I [Dicyemennea floscephalum]